MPHPRKEYTNRKQTSKIVQWNVEIEKVESKKELCLCNLQSTIMPEICKIGRVWNA